ncbi:hypothetical protein [Bradyrhizobium sp. BRP56]|uniref:hypothetical protein n=1 Tax=Bradyrhizobium sp. BRP56 TaxID=2793819 RepID=UPI001CD6E1CD|nr:hypothetical protein [Bradyrhizobium sp. BRP56]MCA1397948.1 hypothetical protein [Bradyrhizobium sp. BRP56]
MTFEPTSAAIGQAAGRSTIRVQENGCDGAPGKATTFTWERVEPLGYAELVAADLNHGPTIPLVFQGCRIIDTDTELDRAQVHTVRLTLESAFRSRTIGLVRNGWLPSALAADVPDTIILLDRNVVSEIVGRFEGGKMTGSRSDFLDLLASKPMRINPVLFAMEGNVRAMPTPALVLQQLEEVAAKLRRALPKAQLVLGSDSLRGAMGLIEESRQGFKRKQAFLMQLAPALTAPVGRKNASARWIEVFAAADACKVPRSSLVVLAALSSIVVPNGQGPAKRLLKFKTNYTEEDAYNALADLRSLEFLIYLFSWFASVPTTFFTADKDLALFWCGLCASEFESRGRGVHCSLAPDKLLPGEYASQWRSWVAEVPTQETPLDEERP